MSRMLHRGQKRDVVDLCSNDSSDDSEDLSPDKINEAIIESLELVQMRTSQLRKKISLIKKKERKEALRRAIKRTVKPDFGTKSSAKSRCEYCAIRNLSMIMELCRMTMSELSSGHNGCCSHESDFDFGDFLGNFH